MFPRQSVCLIAGAALAACARPPGGFDSPDPHARLGAITEAAAAEDDSAIPHLIELLDSDDPVVRLTAIRTLERLTGQTLGYQHWGPERERRQAVEAWVAWYAAQAGRGPERALEGPTHAGAPGATSGMDAGRSIEGGA